MPTSVRPAPFGRLLGALLTIVIASAIGLPTSAMASGDDVLRDCVNGVMKSSYPVADYREALDNLPADLREYSDCEAQIRAARIRAVAEANASTTPYVGRSEATSLPRAAGDSAAAGAGFDAAAATDEGTGTTPDATPSPTPEPAQSAPTSTGTGDPDFFAMPIAGSGGDGPSASAGDGGIPVIPAVIALSVIALTAARGLVAWSRRPERFDADPVADAA